MRIIIALVVTAALFLGSAGETSAAYDGLQSSTSAEDDDSAFVSKTFKALEGDVHAGTEATTAGAWSEGERASNNARLCLCLHLPTAHMRVRQSKGARPLKQNKMQSAFIKNKNKIRERCQP